MSPKGSQRNLRDFLETSVSQLGIPEASSGGTQDSWEYFSGLSIVKIHEERNNSLAKMLKDRLKPLTHRNSFLISHRGVGGIFLTVSKKGSGSKKGWEKTVF